MFRPQVLSALIAVAVGLGVVPSITAAPIFEARHDYAVGEQSYAEIDATAGINLERSPFTVAVGDVDGDGVSDLVSAAQAADFLSIFPGAGDGGVSPVPVDSVGVGLNPRALELTDLNGDGRSDVVVVFPGDNQLGVCLSQGSAPYYPAASFDKYATQNNPTALVVADLDRDGNADVAVANRDRDSVTVFRGGAGGALTGIGHLSVGGTGSMPVSLAALDDDGDGDLEIFVANLGSDDVVRFEHRSGFSFGNAASVLSGLNNPTSVAAADVDGDGAGDLVVSESGADRVTVLLGSGSGTFSPGGSFPSGVAPSWVGVADFDGDGGADLVTADVVDDSVSILRQTSSSPLAFAAPMGYATGDGPTQVVAADLDGDGATDLVTANPLSHNVSVLLGVGDGRMNVAMGLSTLGQSGGGTGPEAVASGERDGMVGLDLVSTNRLSEDGSVFVGDGIGGLLAPTDPGGFATQLPAAQRARTMVLHDFDGDGVAELVTGGTDGVTGKLRIATGAGAIIDAVVSPSRDIVDLEVADIDRDGLDDLLVVDRGDASGVLGHLYLMHGNGNPGSLFNSPVDVALPGITVNSEPIAVFAGRLDGDVWTDAAVLYRNGGQVGVLVNVGGSLGFGPAPTVYTIGKPWGVIPNPKAADLHGGDVDGDGDVDLAAADPGQNIVTVLPNDGTAAFSGSPALLQSRHQSSERVLVADVDEDGRADVLGLNTADNNLSVFRGLAGFSFSDPQSPGGRGAPSNLHLFDLGGDGDLDLALTAFQDDEILLLANLTHVPRAILTGPGPGATNPGTVVPYRSDGGRLGGQAVTAYQNPAPFGTNVAAADLDGTGEEEMVTGPGPSPQFLPQVRSFRADGRPFVVDFIAYGGGGYGVNPYGAELDLDASSELITGPGPGDVYGPHVRGWQYTGAAAMQAMGKVNFYAYGTLQYGAGVGAADLHRDGYDEIVTGAGPGAVFGPHVRGWNFDNAALTQIGKVNFFAYGTLKFGVNSRGGDVDGDGYAEILTGTGPGVVFAPQLRGFNYDSGSLSSISKINAVVFPQWRYGLNLDGGDLDNDGFAEIATGQGDDPAGDARLKVFNYDGRGLAGIGALDLDAYPGLTYGLNVAFADLGRYGR